jgi:spore coat protein U-like protein
MNKKHAAKTLAVALGAAAGMTVSAPEAATLPQNLNVTASVNSTCNVSGTVTDIAFGPISAFLASPTSPVQGTVTWQCNKGASVTLTINNGLHFSGGMRNMQSGSDLIPYHIYAPTGATFSSCAGASTDWPGGGVNVSSLWAASGGPNTISLCGVVDAAPVPGGYAVGASYADQVVVTATF